MEWRLLNGSLMPLNTESSLPNQTSRDSTADSPHSERIARREPRVSLARAIQLDDLSQQSIALRAVWSHLASGSWLVRNNFQTDDRFYFVLEPRPEGTKARRPPPEQVTMLRRALLSERQKVMAYDTDKSHSTVATHLASCLNLMGFAPRASRVPALLVAVLAAEEGRTQIYDARCTFADQDGAPQMIVSTPRLDSLLVPLLTREEFRVARLLVEGMTYANIALDRGSAVRTVANHIASIFRKLGVSGRGELLLFLALNFQAPISGEARAGEAPPPGRGDVGQTVSEEPEAYTNYPPESAPEEP